MKVASLRNQRDDTRRQIRQGCIISLVGQGRDLLGNASGEPVELMGVRLCRGILTTIEDH